MSNCKGQGARAVGNCATVEALETRIKDLVLKQKQFRRQAALACGVDESTVQRIVAQEKQTNPVDEGLVLKTKLAELWPPTQTFEEENHE